MKYRMLLYMVAMFLLMACNNVKKLDTSLSEGQLAIISYNPSEVRVVSLDGMPFPEHSFFSNAEMHVPQGKHEVKATLYWVSSLGSTAHLDISEQVRSACFYAESGRKYIVSAGFEPGGDWFPYMRVKDGFGWETVQSCEELGKNNLR